jgi:hypothetical protein
MLRSESSNLLVLYVQSNVREEGKSRSSESLSIKRPNKRRQQPTNDADNAAGLTEITPERNRMHELVRSWANCAATLYPRGHGSDDCQVEDESGSIMGLPGILFRLKKSRAVTARIMTTSNMLILTLPFPPKYPLHGAPFCLKCCKPPQRRRTRDQNRKCWSILHLRKMQERRGLRSDECGLVYLG